MTKIVEQNRVALFQLGAIMKHFDPQNVAGENDEPVQIVDLDSKGPRQRRRTEVILTAFYQSFAKPWRSYTLIGAVLLILFSTLFLQYHWPFVETSSLKVSTPTSPASPSALVQLQQRPLHFPMIIPGASCPTSAEKQVNANFGIAQGDGPAYATLGTETITSPAVFHYANAQLFGTSGIGPPGWGGQKVLWFINPDYQGLILIRGQQLDGPHSMLFNGNEGEQHFDQRLVLDTTMLNGSPWPNYEAYTILQVPGCYAYQVDGANFSYTIIFQAAVQR
jgi:hypothetical protein